MEFEQVVRRRQMTRSFADDAIDEEVLAGLFDLALRAPSAGRSEGVEWLVVQGEETARFWRAAAEESFLREPGARAGLLRAPVIAVPVADPGAYERRYAEEDKRAGSGLGGVPAAEWPVPYWLVDAAFSVMNLLLAAEAASLGALFFRLHRPPEVLLGEFDIPPGHELIGAVALGKPDPSDPDPTGVVKRRPGRPRSERVHLGSW